MFLPANSIEPANMTRKQVGGEHRAEDEGPFRQPLEGRPGEQLEEQRGQCNINDEGVHPAKRLDRLAGDGRDEKAQEYQAEERQYETDDVGHLPCASSSCRAPRRRVCRLLKHPGIELHVALRQIWREAWTMSTVKTAKFAIGQVVRHRLFPFRGVIFDVDPQFNNTEEWYQAIPKEVRPRKDQPFYHLLAENSETQYIAYVSEQNLLEDDTGEPVRHPQLGEMFELRPDGRYSPKVLARH
jgi:heat shock protein HspQ